MPSWRSLCALLIAGAALFACAKPIDKELIEASDRGDPGRVEQLLRQGAYVDAEDFDSALTPLVAAARKGHLVVVKQLLTAGAKINKPDAGGTPLSWAAFHGHLDVVNYLISKGARLNCQKQCADQLLRVIRDKGYSEVEKIVVTQLRKEAEQS